MLPEHLIEIIDFAIGEEEAAHRFYMDLAAKMDKAYMKEIFEDFAKEELRHKAKLEGVKKGEFFTASFQTIHDLKIGDYMVDVDVSQEMDYQKALVLAMKKEKAAYRLYSDLADKAEDAKIKDVFRALAQEEAKHKLRFEIEYDNVFLSEN
jgi:rubrerythrin